jgi:hypothetical protein
VEVKTERTGLNSEGSVLNMERRICDV